MSDIVYNFDLINEITKEEILDKISEEDIYNFYLGHSIKPNKLYNCCFHKDKTPSLGFYKIGDHINYNCFGCKSQGNVFNFVSNLCSVNYYQALKIIANDFRIRKEEKVQFSIPKTKYSSFEGIYQENSKLEIYPNYRNFNKIDYEYWGRYYLPLELVYNYDIRANDSVYYRNKKGEYNQYCIHNNKNPCYTYILDNNIYKIYRPLNPNKKGKWFTNSNIYNIQGIKQLSAHRDILIITSSLKDVMVLKLLGYEAVAPQGEGMHIPDKIIDYLWATSNNIIIFYDNDDAGIKASEQLANSIGAGSIHIPTKYEEKDISDYTKIYNVSKANKLMKKLL